MYCPDCGHNNPEGNKFCGMCGEPLPDRQRGTTEKVRRERVAQHDPEPVAATFRHREPIDEPVRTRESSAYTASSHGESVPMDQPAVSGPSFLGLGNASDSSSGYSYLYEDEAPKSHAGMVVFLFVLVALGGVLYWQWQPLRTWVVNRANQKVDTGAAAPTQGSATPGSSTASSDNVAPEGGQPAKQQTTPQNDSASPANTPAQNNAAPANKPAPGKTSASPKEEDETRAEPPAKPAPEKLEAKKSSTQARRSPAEKPAVAREAKADDRPAGDDLVASGERYLYGHGAPQNCQQAVVNFNAAAKEENPRAMAHLGALYATGECVPLNRVMAYQWFSRALAKDRSNTYLEHNISMLWREMDAHEKAQVSGGTKEAQNKMF